MSRFWRSKRVLVTGGNGFIGSHVVDILKKQAARVTIPRSDLRSQRNALREVAGSDIVLHLAADVAGIQYNIDHPVEMFESNVLMAKNILHAAQKKSVDRVLLVSSACVYPHQATVPTPESEGFSGDPEPTNLGYGWSKRVIELMGRFYAAEYGMRIAIARPFNTYGPRDNFGADTSHVIPGLIKRVMRNEDPLVVWGTGTQTRSFIFVEDLARALIAHVERYPHPDPLNIGSREEISMKSLAELIIRLSNKKMRVTCDATKPNGQQRRKPDTKKAEKLIGLKATTSLEKGLHKTIAWYRHHLSSLPETKRRA